MVQNIGQLKFIYSKIRCRKNENAKMDEWQYTKR